MVISKWENNWKRHLILNTNNKREITEEKKNPENIALLFLYFTQHLDLIYITIVVYCIDLYATGHQRHMETAANVLYTHVCTALLLWITY